MKLEIRQVISDDTRRIDPKGTFKRNAYPGARGGGYVKKDSLKRYLHGLEEEELRKLEIDLGLNLGNTDESYWATKFILQYDSDRDYVILDTDDIEDYLTWKAGIASGYYAPSVEEVGMSKWINTNFYVHNAEIEQTKKQTIKQLRNQLSRKLATFEENINWLKTVAYALGVPIYQTSSGEYFYNQIDDKKEKAQSIEELKIIEKVMNKDPLELQLNYYVKRGIQHKIITYDGNILSYMFDNKEWGNSDEAVIKAFGETDAIGSFDKLKNEVDAKEKFRK